MIDVVILEGSEWEGADSIASVKMPAIPRVGERITLPIEQHFIVKGVNYHKVQLASEFEVFLLVEHVNNASGYDISAMIG